MEDDVTLKPNPPKKNRLGKTRGRTGRTKGIILQDFKWAGQYKDFFQQKMMPVSEAFIDRLAQDLATWAIQDDDAYKLTQFVLRKGIPPDTFYDWVRQFPTLSDAHKVALEAIGNRRELGGLKKQLDSSIVQFTMPSYDKGWKELREWSAKLKDQEKSQENKIVIIERYGEEPRLTPEEVAMKARHREMGKPSYVKRSSRDKDTSE